MVVVSPTPAMSDEVDHDQKFARWVAEFSISARAAGIDEATLQRAFDNGSLSSTERWTAILTVVIETPRDAERLRKNPLGVYVRAINWSKELSQ